MYSVITNSHLFSNVVLSVKLLHSLNMFKPHEPCACLAYFPTSSLIVDTHLHYFVFSIVATQNLLDELKVEANILQVQIHSFGELIKL